MCEGFFFFFFFFFSSPLIFCLLPLSPQRPASWGYSDRERGQWDRHPGLLATPSRRGAERGGPGIQGNKNQSQQLHQVGASGALIVETHKGEKNRDTDSEDNTDDAQTWKGNVFLVEAHLCTLPRALPLRDDRLTDRRAHVWRAQGAGVNCCETVPSGGQGRLTHLGKQFLCYLLIGVIFFYCAARQNQTAP